MKPLTINDTFAHDFYYTEEHVILFAQASGDHNPLHLDEAYAATTIFKRPIVHGFLGGSVFSKVFGTLWPGEGNISLKQSMQFLRPLYVEETYQVFFTVLEIYQDKQRALIKTEVLNQISKQYYPEKRLFNITIYNRILVSSLF